MPSPSSRFASLRRFDVAICGSGVVGMTLALLLARERLRVALVAPTRAAPVEATAPDVRAYALNAASRTLLESVRGWPDATAVTDIGGMVVWGDDGACLRFDATDQGAAALGWIVDVPALERRLADAVSFQGGVERLEQTPAATLTVVCEGRRSATREAAGLVFEATPYPHHALATRLVAEQAHGGWARQWFRQGEQGLEILALLPMGGAEGREVALVWSLEAAQAAHWRAAEPAALAEAVADRCGHALGALSPAGPAQTWPLEKSRAPRWIARTERGAVVLAGDAAHAMHPMAGQGLNVGLGDAAELARVLQGREFWRELGDLRLLRRYERARQADVAAMTWLTDGLFGLFGHEDARVQALRNWGLRGVDRLAPLKSWLARQAMGQ